MSIQKKGKGKVLIVVLLLGILVFAANAFALPQGTLVEFEDEVIPPAGNTSWTHSLDATDVWKEGTEPRVFSLGTELLNVSEATLYLTLDFEADCVGNNCKYKSFVSIPYLDGGELSTYVSYSGKKRNVKDKKFEIPIDPSALAAIGDRQFTISLVDDTGSLKNIDSSIVKGEGTIAPEPVSMLLVGIGMLGLPFLRRMREFAIKGKQLNGIEASMGRG